MSKNFAMVLLFRIFGKYTSDEQAKKTLVSISNRHVGSTVTDKSRVIHQKNAKFCPSAQHEDKFSSFGE